ncbi:iron uptake porin [Calothrix sp. PCC 6303]|uniref:iron uptake porin n=1 Tax=Calothrix sp. PCC 6303 TaxID=1170562 RepID=UPI0002A0159F|nr:iron uptake porin [Calothrix sp. PCC 6303]AFZ01084.1 cyanobacterial porin [Calothrix sp. PCC 6303]
MNQRLVFNYSSYSFVCQTLLIFISIFIKILSTTDLSFARENQADSLDTISQVSSVSQLSDVQPTDWAFQALQSLVERYGCIAGYPNGTYRGNRAITRYEFAAGLNACLDRANELIATATGDLAKKEDLATLQRLQEEFKGELATLRSRIDTVEMKTAELDANQFSATTKLEGEVILGLTRVFGGNSDGDDNPNNHLELNENITLGQRTRLNFITSFTGKDTLNLRLEGGNITELDDSITGTRMTRLGFDEDSGNDVGLGELYYQFPVGDRLKATIAGWEMELNDIAEPLNPLDSSGSGAISRFGRYNPILRSMEGTGLGVNYQVNLSTNLAFAYVTNDASLPTEKNGLFDGNYSALGNVTFQPSDNFGIALTYLHSYYGGGSESGVNLTGSTGSLIARRPFGNVSTSTDTFGLETSLKINPGLIISGWVGYIQADAKVSNDEADIWNYAVTLAMPDLGGKGNLAGLIVGMPPKVTSSSLVADRDTSLHIEGFYKFQVTDNISITPGVFVITNPEHNDSNQSIVVGTVRTTFKF